MTREVQGTNKQRFLRDVGVALPIRFLFPNATSHRMLTGVTQQPP